MGEADSYLSVRIRIRTAVVFLFRLPSDMSTSRWHRNVYIKFRLAIGPLHTLYVSLLILAQ